MRLRAYGNRYDGFPEEFSLGSLFLSHVIATLFVGRADSQGVQDATGNTFAHTAGNHLSCISYVIEKEIGA